MRAGALLGAGGATAYYNGVDSNSFWGSFFAPSWGSGQRWAAQGRSSELDDLYKMVRSCISVTQDARRCESLATPRAGLVSVRSTCPCSWRGYPGMCTVITGLG